MKNHQGIEVKMGDQVRNVEGVAPWIAEVVGFKDGDAVIRDSDSNECHVYNANEMQRDRGRNVWVIS